MQESPLDNYMKFQEFVKKEATDIATQVYNELGTKYNVAQVPTHSHNGIDSVAITESVVTTGNKNLSGLIFDTSETITVTGLNLNNMKRIVLHGFAANNKSAPATKRAIINGEIQFGRCYSLGGSGTGTITVDTNAPGTPFIQISNAMYVDSTDLTKNRVSTTGFAFVSVSDDTSTEIVRLTLDSYTRNSMTFTCTLSANWKVQANIIIS